MAEEFDETGQYIGHYYGNSIRGIFIFAGVVMVVLLPFFSSVVAMPILWTILGILVLAVFGGWMNPHQRWIMVVDFLVSMGAFGVFEYYAVYAYLHLPPTAPINVLFFWTNQILALFFFLAIYLSVKTVRAKIMLPKNK